MREYLAYGALAAGLLVPSNSLAVCSSVAGGDSSAFNICDSLITDNGLPSGGECSGGAAGSGAGILDATIIPAGFDAYDFAAMLWVDSVQLGGAMTVAGNRVTFAPQTLSGLTVQSVMDVLATEATLRNYISFANPSASSITVQLDYANNFGSNGNTTIEGSSSGDTVFDTADTWVVTSDSVDGDAVNTIVLGDSGTMVPLTVAGTTVFGCGGAGTEGLLGTFSLTVPADTTVAMVFFHRLTDTAANALAAASDFDTIPAGSPLLDGLTTTEIDQIVNLGVGGGGVRTLSILEIPTLQAPLLVALALLLALLAVITLRRRVI